MTCGAPWPGAEKALRQERNEGMEKMRRISAAVGCPNSVEEVVEAVAAIKSDLASERAHLAACQTRIAGLEQAANERSAEVARLTARVAELEARPVLTVERLAGAVASTVMTGGAGSTMNERGSDHHAKASSSLAAAILAKLGPVTLPLPAQDRAEDLTQAIHGTPREEVNPAMWRGMVERTRSALASLGAPPTSPPAARPVFAGVSEDDLCVQMLMAADPSIDPGVALTMVKGVPRAKVRAVLTRLKTTLVAPVDPREFALVMIMRDLTDDNGDVSTTAVEAAARYALTARGIPVTPEVGK